MKKQPETKFIGGMKCLNRDLAAKYVGLSTSTLDRIVAATRAGRAKVRVKFIQMTSGSPMWFPQEWLDSFALEVMEKGRAI